MVRNVGGWETTFSSRLEASDQSICLSPGKSFLASRAHQRISVSVPASIVQHLWPDTTLYAFFSIAIHVEFKSAAVVPSRSLQVDRYLADRSNQVCARPPGGAARTGSPGPLTEAWQQQRLFEALARAILGARQPLLLLLDDLQWCDRETLEWLHYLLRFDAHARLLIMSTVRPEEPTPAHPLEALLAALRRDGQVTEIALGPLD